MAATTYDITWTNKPLGFSIVMDTTGKNAYVSSIQKDDNIKKGLKLAAQIITINGQNAKNEKHQDILDMIKGAVLPMKLVFQPRSFANEAKKNPKETVKKESDDEDSNVPHCLLLGGAPDSNKHRVDGLWDLTVDKINGKHVWQRHDEEVDPVLMYWWPAKTMKTKGMTEDLWMIARKTMINTQSAYACCPQAADTPLEITKKWKVYDKDAQKFVECDIHVAAEVDDKQTKLDN